MLIFSVSWPDVVCGIINWNDNSCVCVSVTVMGLTYSIAWVTKSCIGSRDACVFKKNPKKRNISI